MSTSHLENEIRNFKRELKEIKSGTINQTKHDKNKIKKLQQQQRKAVVEIPDVLTKSSSIYKISSHYGISESVARVVKPSMRYFDKNKELINILSQLVDLLPTKTKPRKINSYKDFITYINGYMVFPVPVSAMAYIDFFATNSKYVSTKQVEAFSRLFYGESLKDLIVANFGLSKSEYKYFITSNNTSFNDCYIRSKFYNYNWSAIANHEVSNKIVPTNINTFSYMSGIVSLVKKLLDSKYTLDKISEVMDYIRNMRRFNQVDFDLLLKRSARNIVAECDVWHDTLRMAKVKNNTAWESIGYSCVLKESYDENNTLISAMVIDELVNARQLATEGRTQSHCVYSYVRYCMTGKTSIVSLRHTNASGIIKPLVTIEIDNNKKHIVQVRGKANRQPTQAEKQLIQLFANNKGLVYKV